MQIDERAQLLFMLKAIADESRLGLLHLMHGQERTVGDLADSIGLGEPTVSHHLSKLRESGFVTLRTAGNQRFYRINSSGLARFKELAGRIETLAPAIAPEPVDDSWIDQLELSSEDKKTLRAHIRNGRLTRLPGGPKRTEVILRWVITKFEPGRLYTESEVNELLKTVYSEDPVSLRRDLVDFGYLRRERGGGKYWVTPEDEGTLSDYS